MASPRSARWLLLLSLAAIAAGWLSMARGCDDARRRSARELDAVEEGTFAAESPQPASDTFTVTSWNIQYGRAFPQIQRALSTIVRADIHLLQEVDRMTNRSWNASKNAPRDLAQLLARRLEMHYAYGIEFQELMQDAANRPAFTGQLTVSAYPLEASEAVRFEHQLADWSRGLLALFQKRHGGRMFLYSRARVGSRALHLYNVHLESRASDHERSLQMKEVLDHVARVAGAREPVIIAGDFNTELSGASPVIELLRGEGFTDPLLERSRQLSTKKDEDARLDWIFSRHLEPVDARIAEEFMGSDHRAVTATYEMHRSENQASRLP